MKNIFHFTIALSLATLLFACSSEPASIAAKDQDSKTVSVNAALFLSGGLAESISTVACTLSEGYHAATGQTTKVEQKDGHAAMIGYAMDGYGLFEQLDEAGNKASDLDECRGHYDDVRGDHYHVDKAGANNFIGCLRGAYAKE
jgi:hypothetical protein